MDSVDVLIVGAGPTGLTLAATLAAHGVRPRVIDRSTDRVHESRALAIQPRTLEVLAALGVTPALLAAGNEGVRLCLHAGRRELTTPLFSLGMDDTAYPYLLFLSQAETERILGEQLAAAGVTVDRPAELVGLEIGDDAVVATVRRDGVDEAITARYVVGCDGAHSAVRSGAGIGFEGDAYPQSFVLADLEADGIAPGSAHAFLSGSGIMFFFPLATPATWRLLGMRPAHEDVAPGTPLTLDEVQSLADDYTGRTVRLRDPVWLTNFRIHHRAAARYRAGRVFLAGDAAHIHSPAGGQGMNTGIQDAVNLGWKLAQVCRGQISGGQAESIMDSYEAERAPVGRRVVRVTDRLFRIATSNRAAVRFARRHIAPRVAPLALRLRTGRAYAFRTLSQLAIRYRSSPLSVDGPGAPARGPRAGDRMPDARIVHNGESTTLHATIAGPGWKLLRSGPPGDWPSTSLTTVQLDADGCARLGLRPGEAVQYLIRPDGHVGYRSGPNDGDGLDRYRRRWAASPTLLDGDDAA